MCQHKQMYRSTTLFLFLLAINLTCGLDVNQIEKEDLEFLKSLDTFTASSTFCSKEFIPRFDRKILGHDNLMLPISTSYFLPTISCKNLLQCTSMIWRDFLISRDNKLDITEGEDNFFYFTRPHEQENTNSQWKITLVGGLVSQLPVYEISSRTERFYAKFYPFPEASDALQADMISMYAIAQLPNLQYVKGTRTLQIKKCVMGSGSEVKPYFITLSRGVKGISLSQLLLAKKSQEEIMAAIFLVFRALGDFQSISSQVKRKEPDIFLPSSQSLEYIMYSKLQDEISDKKKLQTVITEESELFSEMKKQSKKHVGVIPNVACYSHNDLSVNNIYIDLTTNLVTFIDAASMYLSVDYYTDNSRISCEDDNFVTTPYYNFLPRAHPAYDYFFLLIYTKLTFDDASIAVAAKQGFCSGWFKNSPEAIDVCFKGQLWPEIVEIFYQRMVILHLSPKVYTFRFSGSENLPQNVPKGTAPPTPEPAAQAGSAPPVSSPGRSVPEVGSAGGPPPPPGVPQQVPNGGGAGRPPLPPGVPQHMVGTAGR